jgi:hypothetical protein
MLAVLYGLPRNEYADGAIVEILQPSVRNRNAGRKIRRAVLLPLKDDVQYFFTGLGGFAARLDRVQQMIYSFQFGSNGRFRYDVRRIDHT